MSKYIAINDENEQELRLSDLAILLFYNLCRDACWTYAAEDDQTEHQQILTSFLGQLAGLLFLILAQSFAKCIWGSKKSIQEIAVTTIKRSCGPILASTVAVPVWTGIVDLSTEQCLNRGLSSNTAGYIAGLFPGFVEGPAQQACIIVSNLAKTAERAALRQEPRKYLLNAGKDMLLSIIPGFIPGNVWQLVYNACKTHNLSPYVAVMAVSGGTGSSSFCCAMIQKLTKPKLCKAKADAEAKAKLDAIKGASWCEWTRELLLEKDPEIKIIPLETSPVASVADPASV